MVGTGWFSGLTQPKCCHSDHTQKANDLSDHEIINPMQLLFYGILCIHIWGIRCKPSKVREQR
jgi:hypothetical protein